jgi:hypothetical protein
MYVIFLLFQEAVEDFLFIKESSWSLKHTPTSSIVKSVIVKPGEVAPPLVTNTASVNANNEMCSGSMGASVNSSDGTINTTTIDMTPHNTNNTPNATTHNALTTPIKNTSIKGTLSSPRSRKILTATSSSIAKAASAVKETTKSIVRRRALLPTSNNYNLNTNPETMHWEVKRELRIRELNCDLERGNDVLDTLDLPAVELLEYPQRFPIGATVFTLFGKGFIANYRTYDGIYEVVVEWDLTKGVNPAPAVVGKGVAKTVSTKDTVPLIGDGSAPSEVKPPRQVVVKVYLPSIAINVNKG